MLKIVITIEQIDYEASIESLLPRLVKKCAAAQAPSERDKLIARLGPDAVPVAKRLLQYLDQSARDQIIIAMLEPFRGQLIQVANARLEEMLGGKAVVIGGFEMQDLPGSWLTLSATQVSIDYGELAESPLLSRGILGGAAKLAIQMASPATIERQVMTMLMSDFVKPKLLSALSDALRKLGLIVTLQDMTFWEDTGTELSESEKKNEGLLPDAVEDQLIDAVVAWMRESV